jgi:hypothetical protein
VGKISITLIVYWMLIRRESGGFEGDVPKLRGLKELSGDGE